MKFFKGLADFFKWIWSRKTKIDVLTACWVIAVGAAGSLSIVSQIIAQFFNDRYGWKVDPSNPQWFCVFLVVIGFAYLCFRSHCKWDEAQNALEELKVEHDAVKIRHEALRLQHEELLRNSVRITATKESLSGEVLQIDFTGDPAKLAHAVEGLNRLKALS